MEMLREDDSIELIIKAHADSRGDDDYNLLLSMRRAKTVEKELVSKGIPQDRFQIAWVGEREPFIDYYNQRCTEEEHAYNRRVEFILIDGNQNRVASE